MQFNQVEFSGQVPIDSYGPGFFRIAGEVHHGPVGLLPDAQFKWTDQTDFTRFMEQAGQFDVLFVGMGSDIAALPEKLLSKLEQAGIGVEVMATPAACRTYNVLLSEGRRIAAALIPL